MNNPVNMVDEDGCLAAVATLGATAVIGKVATAVGAANIWNSVGWAALGLAAGILTVEGIKYYKKSTAQTTTTAASSVSSNNKNDKNKKKSEKKDKEHTSNRQPSNWDKHTKPRSGRSNTKNRLKSNWKPNPNKRK